MIRKNIAAQGLYLFAVDTTASPPVGKTGDAANITGKFSIDGAAEDDFGTAHPTEIGGGVYWQPLAQAETAGDAAAYRWVSGTTGVVIDPAIVLTTGVNLPVTAPGTADGLIFLGANVGGLSINNAGGDAIQLQGGDGGSGLRCLGDAQGGGITSVGGATGDGIVAAGGATGRGIGAYGQGAGMAGIYAVGGDAAPGIDALGVDTGAGIRATGGDTDGAGVQWVAGGAGLPVDPDIWTVTVPGAYASGNAGYVLGHISGGGGDPWVTALPGAYDPGTAGAILGAILFDANGFVKVDVEDVLGDTAAPTSAVDSNVVSVNGTTFVGANVPGKVVTYATGQDPATLLLISPTHLLASDASGFVTVVTNNDKTSYALTAGERTAIATALLKLDWTGLTGEASHSVLNALRYLRNGFAISGTTLTVFKEDGSTSAWTSTITVTPGADPITGQVGS